tara:strand:- start:2 stop:463 length:462 start_codon:yes stop_codon:yes gene_type:complete
MAFIGNIFGAYAARQAAKYNQALYYQQAALDRRNAEIKEKTFENILLPRLLKNQERNRSSLLVNLLKSGVDVDRVGETPYLMMLEQRVEDSFDVSLARYNSRVTYQNEINRSLLTEARGRGERFKGDLAFRTGILKAGGDIYANREEYGSLLS